MTHKEMCIKIWEYLALTGDKNKNKAIRNLFNKELAHYLIHEHHGCPACLEAFINKKTGNHQCEACPIDWGHGSCMEEGANYVFWRSACCKITRIEQARKVLFLIRTTWKEGDNAKNV